jgi:hypothetical protein
MPQRTIPRFVAGKPLLDQLTAERLNAMLDLIESKGVQLGNNMTGMQTSSGMIIRSKIVADGGKTSVDASFVVSLTSGPNPDNPDVDIPLISVRDGKVNGEFPEGMGTGTGSLKVRAPSDAYDDCLIYVEVKFDGSSLDLTSLDVKTTVAAGFPANTITSSGGTIEGTLNVLVGFTYVDPAGTAHAFNTHVGDINFELVASSLNGAPALLPVSMFGGFLAYPA